MSSARLRRLCIFLLANIEFCATISITSVFAAGRIRCGGYVTKENRGGYRMIIEIDFNSDEAIYMQLTNQIIMGIATSRLQQGE